MKLLRPISEALGLAPLARKFKPAGAAEEAFSTSREYWEKRYVRGGNSGAGSYNQLAAFKARFLNKLVSEKQITSVIEFGCGDGAQLELAEYPRYVGVDVAPTAIEMCRARFAGDATKSFYLSDDLPEGLKCDASLSLDVIYHLIEDSVFEAYMRSLFSAAERYVIVYASNKDDPAPAPHVRHRIFTDWVQAQEPGWELIDFTKNDHPFDPADPDNTSFADFYTFSRK